MMNSATMKRADFCRDGVSLNPYQETEQVRPEETEGKDSAAAVTVAAVKPYCHTVFHTENTTLEMLWHKQAEEMILTVPCASSWVDCEEEITRFLREHWQKTDGQQVIFRERKITLRCRCVGDTLPPETVHKIGHLLERACQHFDLLPTCMCCQRTITATVEECPTGLRTICGICRDERRMRQEHYLQVERQHIEAIHEMKEERNKQRPILQLGKIGVWGGLCACGVGFLFFVLGLFLDIFNFMPCFPGAVAGICIVSRLHEVVFYPKGFRFVVSALAAIAAISVISCLMVGFFTFCLPLHQMDGYTLFTNVGFLNLTSGVVGFLLGAFLTSFFAE